MLSKDPRNLDNLDQDLVNSIQETVPIYSLPQEWLWCETWCGESSRKQANIIDLVRRKNGNIINFIIYFLVFQSSRKKGK